MIAGIMLALGVLFFWIVLQRKGAAFMTALIYGPGGGPGQSNTT